MSYNSSITLASLELLSMYFSFPLVDLFVLTYGLLNWQKAHSTEIKVSLWSSCLAVWTQLTNLFPDNTELFQSH